MARLKSKIRRNDLVMVIAGRERGKTGRVQRVLLDENKVVVERINLVKRHLKARGMTQAGGIIEREAPLHLSNVMVFCERCNAPVRIGIKVSADGSKLRVCRRCGEALGAG